MDMNIDSIDYTDPSRAPDPYRMLDYLSEHQPVYREPHHGVVMVTGHEEADLGAARTGRVLLGHPYRGPGPVVAAPRAAGR